MLVALWQLKIRGTRSLDDHDCPRISSIDRRDIRFFQMAQIDFRSIGESGWACLSLFLLRRGFIVFQSAPWSTLLGEQRGILQNILRSNADAVHTKPSPLIPIKIIPALGSSNPGHRDSLLISRHHQARDFASCLTSNVTSYDRSH